MTLDRVCHCSCSSAKHRLSFQTPCAYYKGLKLNLPHNSKSWAMLCSPYLCGGMDRWHQSMLLFSTGITDVKHKACTPLAVCLAPGTPTGPWKDTTALQHAQIPGPCPSFAGRTAAWLKMAKWYIYSPRWNFTQTIGAAGSFYFYLWM